MGHHLSFRWVAIGESVTGASHVRAALPKQDDIRFFVGDGGNAPVVLALSDGHGSVKCFRSDCGAQLAVEIAVDTTRAFLTDLGLQSSSAAKRVLEGPLISSIVRRWRDAVDSDLRERPFTDSELVRLEKCLGLPRERCEDMYRANQHYLAYGATLLLVGLGDNFAFFAQLGDGDILTVSREGEVVSPLPPDDASIANETCSLCQDQAKNFFRIRFQYFVDGPPELILASTDGYSNSFASTDDFLKVGKDFHEFIRGHGAHVTQDNLRAWLARASELGSGDDVTVGILCRQVTPLAWRPRENAADMPDTTGATGPDDPSPSVA